MPKHMLIKKFKVGLNSMKMLGKKNKDWSQKLKKFLKKYIYNKIG